MKIIAFLIACMKYLSLTVAYLLCIPAIYFSSEFNKYFCLAFTWGFIIGVPLLLIVFRKEKLVFWMLLAACLVFLIIFFSLPPSNYKNWTRDVAVLPSVAIDKNKVHIKNIRNFQYKSEFDYTPTYYDKTFDVNKLTSLDYILSYWDGKTTIAHTLLSFGFNDNSYICVSVETRREEGEPQTALRGMYNQYELIYILADEKDLLGLRTNFRKEEVFMYPMNLDADKIRMLFMQIMKKVTTLETKPQFYNTLENNCFTSLLNQVRKVFKRAIEFDYRFILTGRSDELGHERGWFITNDLPFHEFKNKHHVNQYIPEGKIPDNYSSIIRKHKHPTRMRN